MEGCIAIINGDSPRALEQKLSIYLPHAAHGKKH
jgi:flagellar motor component MotA